MGYQHRFCVWSELLAYYKNSSVLIGFNSATLVSIGTLQGAALLPFYLCHLPSKASLVFLTSSLIPFPWRAAILLPFSTRIGHHTMTPSSLQGLKMEKS